MQILFRRRTCVKSQKVAVVCISNAHISIILVLSTPTRVDWNVEEGGIRERLSVSDKKSVPNLNVSFFFASESSRNCHKTL